MNCKWFISILLLACIASHCVFAQSVKGDEDTYAAPTSVRDTIALGDSIVVIHTVCAPICSSHARVFNKEWQVIGELKAPFRSIFPEAYIENNQILWRDNDTLSYTPCL